MPCTTRRLTANLSQQRQADLDKLRAGLRSKQVSVVIGKGGSLAFKGWSSPLAADLCAYRQLLGENNLDLRLAIAKAEALAGARLNPTAIASGLHSHDGGATWSRD